MTGLYHIGGGRKYLNAAERAAFVRAAQRCPREVRAFAEVLHGTGCRISEGLALTRGRVDFAGQALIFETLKKRRRGVFRAVPVSPALLDMLALVFNLRAAHAGLAAAKLWPWSRATGSRRIAEIMQAAGISGPHACPRGLRHGFGVAAATQSVPPNLIKKWMGHANLETTSIYLDAIGAEERDIAARLWAANN